jgi:uncharacterized membrane protein
MSGEILAGRPGGWGRLGIVVLTLSLTLNVFFVGGLLWARSVLHPPLGPVQRMESVAAEMHLSGDQLAAFRTFVNTMRDHQIALHQRNRAIIETLWDELAHAKPDEAKIEGLVDQANDNRRASQKETGKALIAFLATLSPEQRAQFADLAKIRRQEPMLQRLMQGGPH